MYDYVSILSQCLSTECGLELRAWKTLIFEKMAA
jgi:hypothetical protein